MCRVHGLIWEHQMRLCAQALPNNTALWRLLRDGGSGGWRTPCAVRPRLCTNLSEALESPAVRRGARRLEDAPARKSRAPLRGF